MRCVSFNFFYVLAYKEDIDMDIDIIIFTTPQLPKIKGKLD